MSQFLVLAHPRRSKHVSAFGVRYRATLDDFLVESGRKLFGSEDIFVCDSPQGEPFEAWFDLASFGRALLDEVIDDCVDNFASLALFYGDVSDVERASDVTDLKRRVDAAWQFPVELYVAWSERL
jgi:hypothetical protein